ncbi:transcriptional regulator [Acidovorax sp. CF316]|uniref:LysR family transcriptional regulator n=1 Tax=Acidovorax sp. CF316 TaxID=1144317 RepID=UPI00026BE1A4|nr:LysR family transcriptional regulator [Acidovorax sp. CF316]EJE53189.1 transcriptional regulator [Acidovorax sp. CF316]
MNLQQFEHLLAVAETGSFSRAAEQLYLTQPALSRSILAMEDELGAPLIERAGKRKALTPLGVLVAARARRIGLEVSELKRSASLLAGLEIGSAKLGLGPAPTAMLAVPLLQHMLAQHPRIHIQLSSGPAELQLQSLRARTLDALVIHRRTLPPADDLDVELFPDMRLGFVCRSGHPLHGAAQVAFAQLRQYPLAGTGLSDEAVHSLNAHFGRTAHFSEALQIQSDEVACLLDVVRTTDAVFLGTIEAARALIDQGELAELRLTRPLRLTSQFAFVTLEGISQAPALKVVRDFCAQRMGGG